jgi:hypothetical protein
MEGDLWPVLYRLIYEEDNRRPRKKGVQYSDGRILEVYCWAVVHDRPTSWACEERSWAAHERWRPRDRARDLPCDATMSERLRTLSLRHLLAAVLDRLRAIDGPHRAGPPPPPTTPTTLPPRLLSVRALDSKPLAVGPYSKDRDARWGQVAEKAKARGYKLFCAWRAGAGGGRGDAPVMPDAWTLGAMNRADSEAAASAIVPELAGDGYLLGDAAHDSNPLHEACEALEGRGRGCLRLLAPRKKPGTGLGHVAGGHRPGRLRSIEMTEWPVTRGTTPCPFAAGLYAMRGDIERRFGNCTSFGGGLQPLPSWVRRPHRVALWVAVKLAVNALRQCKRKGLAA